MYACIDGNENIIRRYRLYQKSPPWGRPKELTCLGALVIVTFIAEATEMVRIIVADYIMLKICSPEFSLSF